MADFFEEVLADSEHAAERKAQATRKPWWQLTKTVRQGFVMSGDYLVLAVGALIVSVTGPGSPVVTRMFAVLWLVFSSCFLVSTVVIRRRQQNGREAGAPSEDSPGMPGPMD